MIYMYKEDLGLNNPQWLICHKTQPNPTKPNSLSVCLSLDFVSVVSFTNDLGWLVVWLVSYYCMLCY